MLSTWLPYYITYFVHEVANRLLLKRVTAVPTYSAVIFDRENIYIYKWLDPSRQLQSWEAPGLQ